MHFSLTFPEGTEILSTYSDQPLDFTFGDNTMEPMLEFALLGLRAGEEQELLVSGDDVYGPRQDSLIHWLDKGAFAANQSLNPGEIIAFTTPEGEELAGTVVHTDNQRVQIDFNHPLSGKSFHYRVTILAVEPSQDQDTQGND
jgi:FKBP-type peptidyl-prolyl cis-trans isomerase SlpA